MRDVTYVKKLPDQAEQEVDIMKIIITQKEALDRHIWDKLILMFGLQDKEDDVWENEQFILTEEQARELGLI